MRSKEPETIKLLSSEITIYLTLDSCFNKINFFPVYMFKKVTVPSYYPHAIKLLHLLIAIESKY